jgi:hypothetical protein
VLEGAGQVGCQVGKDRFDIAKINPAGHVLGGVVEDHGDIDRQSAEHLAYVIGAVLKVEGVGIKRDRPRGVPGDGGDECGMSRENGAGGWFCTRAVRSPSWTMGFAEEVPRLGVTALLASRGRATPKSKLRLTGRWRVRA